MSTRWLAAAPLLVAATLAAPAGARGGPSLSSIPAGVAPAELSVLDAPPSIGAAEQVEGITFTRQPSEHPPLATSAVGLRRTKGMPAQSFPAFDTLAAAGGRCLSLAAEGTSAAPMATVMASGGVFMFRSERLVPGADGAMALEIVRAWADPRNLGVREGGKSTIALVELGRSPEEMPGTHEPLVKVYGYRTEGGLELVITPGAPLFFRGPDGGFGNASCGVARVTLPTDRPAATVAAASTITLPPRPSTGSTEPARAPLVRTVTILASVSRLSRDPEPVLSVSIGRAESPEEAAAANPPTPVELE